MFFNNLFIYLFFCRYLLHHFELIIFLIRKKLLFLIGLFGYMTQNKGKIVKVTSSINCFESDIIWTFLPLFISLQKRIRSPPNA